MTPSDPDVAKQNEAVDGAAAREPFRVIAILAAYNEEDIVGQAVAHLIEQGVLVHFIDNGSTDGTVRAVEPFLGKGLLQIEQLSDQPTPGSSAPLFRWDQILRRKEHLAQVLDADWFIHHDADEFRESPWTGRRLADAIRLVDRSGYNAIDFAVFNFWPTHNRFMAGDDVREVFRHYEPGRSFDRLQIKCWKKTDVAVDLATSGGHDAMFPGRRIFPIRFLLRHYPIRGQEHGKRKVFLERRARFDPDERARGWHVQYDEITETQDFIRDPATLAAFDPDAVRLQLVLDHRGVEALQHQAEVQERELGEFRLERDRQTREMETLERHLAELRLTHDGQVRAREALQHGLDALQLEHDRRIREVEALGRELERTREESAMRAAEVGSLREMLEETNRDMQQQILAVTSRLEESRAALSTREEELRASVAEAQGLKSSRSWRLTRPLRWIFDRLQR
jgi:hypothetical protein